LHSFDSYDLSKPEPLEQIYFSSVQYKLEKTLYHTLMYLMFPLNIRYQRTGPLAFILVSFSFSPEESSEKKTHKRAEKETAELWCLLPNRKHQSMPSRRHEGWPRRGHKSVLRRTRRHQSLPERRYESLPTLCPYALMPTHTQSAFVLYTNNITTSIP